MDTAIAFLTQTIYGVALIAAVVAALPCGIAMLFKRRTLAIAIAAVAFVATLATVPSYPRFAFERQVREQIDAHPHLRVVREVRGGDLTEPITWFYAPAVLFDVVGPADPLVRGTFARAVFRYDEPVTVTREDPDCGADTLSVAEPDDKGTFRYTKWAVPLGPEDRTLYCESDWSKEYEGLRQQMSRRTSQ